MISLVAYFVKVFGKRRAVGLRLIQPPVASPSKTEPLWGREREIFGKNKSASPWRGLALLFCLGD